MRCEKTINSNTATIVCPVTCPAFISAINLVTGSAGDKGLLRHRGPLKLAHSVLHYRNMKLDQETEF